MNQFGNNKGSMEKLSNKREKLTEEVIDQGILNQYFTNLQLSYEKVKFNHNSKNTNNENFNDICKKIDDLLSEEKSWTNAGSVEQYLILLLDYADLDSLLRNKLQKPKR